MLEFDPVQHLYKWDGFAVPSVTQILKPISDYDGIPRYIMDIAADRGNRVHKATELYDAGDLDEDSIDSEVAGYLEGWKKFRDSYGYSIAACELRVFSIKKGYAGTLDRLLVKNDNYYLGDIKTTAIHVPSVGPQTAGYAAAVEEELGIKIKGRLSIRLLKDGKPEVVELKDRNDLGIFYNCLTIAKWRKQYHGHY